jgi:protein TonB
MTRAALLLAFTLCSVAAAPSPTSWPTPPTVDIPPNTQTGKAKVLALKSPRPEYPLEARKHRWVGVGWFVMHVDEPSGAVTSVEIAQSTGHKILDRAAVEALRKWRLVPHSGLKKVKTPITFSMLPNEKA